MDRALEKVGKSVTGMGLVPARKIFVGGIPNLATREELMRLFSQFGAINDLSLPLKTPSENKGYAFVIFEDPEAVKRVLESHRPLILRAKQLDIKNVNNEIISESASEADHRHQGGVFWDLVESEHKSGIPLKISSNPSVTTHASSLQNSNKEFQFGSEARSKKTGSKVLSGKCISLESNLNSNFR